MVYQLWPTAFLSILFVWIWISLTMSDVPITIFLRHVAVACGWSQASHGNIIEYTCCRSSFSTVNSCRYTLRNYRVGFMTHVWHVDYPQYGILPTVTLIGSLGERKPMFCCFLAAVGSLVEIHSFIKAIVRVWMFPCLLKVYERKPYI